MAGSKEKSNSTTTALLQKGYGNEHTVTRGREEEEGGKRPKEGWKGEFVKSIVYAALDAIITSFSLISSISAGRLSSVDVLVLGFANLVADAISMGFGDFISTNTARDVAVKERDVTKWDVTHHPSSQLIHLLQRYHHLGMSPDDAAIVVEIFGKYKDILVDEKMMGEKGMVPPDEEDKPWKNGLVTFTAFIIFGSAPLLSFIILIPFTNSDTTKFVGACVLSILALAILGILKAKIAGQSYAASAAITVFNGGLAASAAYALGWTLRNVADVDG